MKKVFTPVSINVFYLSGTATLVASSNYTGNGSYDDGGFGNLGDFNW